MYVPTNHLYIGDIFLVNARDVIRPNLSVREGIGKRSFHHQILLKIYALGCSISDSTIMVEALSDMLFSPLLQRLLYLVACRCLRYCQRWIQEVFKSIEDDLTETTSNKMLISHQPPPPSSFLFTKASFFSFIFLILEVLDSGHNCAAV